MKKFENGDIFYNSIKAHPKVKFFVNSGSVVLNNNRDLGGNAVLFDFLRLPQASGIDCAILQEDGYQILTENGDSILIEDC